MEQVTLLDTDSLQKILLHGRVSDNNFIGVAYFPADDIEVDVVSNSFANFVRGANYQINFVRVTDSSGSRYKYWLYKQLWKVVAVTDKQLWKVVAVTA